MVPLNYYDVAGQQITTHNAALHKLEWTIDAGAAASGLFVQIHDKQTIPTTGNVPKKVWPTGASDRQFKTFADGELRVNNGLYIVISSTEATYTVAAAGDKFDTLAVENFAAERSVTVVGDLTSSVDELEVWAESAGPKKLTRLQVTRSSTAATRYILLFAHDNPQTGDVPILVLGRMPISVTISFDFDFGDGLDVRSNDADHTLRQGCTICASTSAASLIVPAANFQIRAEYV